MPIPHILMPVRPQDFTITPIKVHKRYTITNNEWSSSGYTNHEALYSNIVTPISSSKALNDPKNSDGTYKHIAYHAINARFYKFPYDIYAGGEHWNRRLVYKNLFLTASIMSVPYMDSGEGLKRRSLEITSSGRFMQDDGYGNVYDTLFVTSSFPNRHKLVAYWGFNDLYRGTRYGFGYKPYSSIEYKSNTHEPEEKAVGKNLYVLPGVTVHTPRSASGCSLGFRGETTVVAPHTKYFNMPTNRDFTISFFVKLPATQANSGSNQNTILSKRGTIRKQTFGTQNHMNANGKIIPTKFVSSSIFDQSTDVYPYHFDVLNQNVGTGSAGTVRFSRSNGPNSLTLSTSTSLITGDWEHISVVKSGSLISLYLNAVLESSANDVPDNPSNDHMLVFGAYNRALKEAFSGSLDEVRFYNYGCSVSELETLAERETGSLYQTSVVGNCFYKNSTIVISSFLPKYDNIFDENATWNFSYRNIHTIYQNETLCRIPKGSANLSMNPTARQDPDSDLFINEFTGSVLKPYITTIGLYNSKGELVAIGRLGQPVQVRDDVDMNIMIRWDW